MAVSEARCCRHGRAKKNLLDLQSPEEEAKSADPFFTTVPSSSPSSPQRPSALPPEAPPPLLFLPACQANGREEEEEVAEIFHRPLPLSSHGQAETKKAHSGNEGEGAINNRPAILRNSAPKPCSARCLWVGRRSPFLGILSKKKKPHGDTNDPLCSVRFIPFLPPSPISAWALGTDRE